MKGFEEVRARIQFGHIFQIKRYKVNKVIEQKAVHCGLPFVIEKMKIWRFIMADERTEKQKVQEITDKLEQGLKELFESEKYKSYLSTMSKFHNYSFNNTLLIAMQKPDATLVAGYKAW